ncbi:hypothetical protein [Anaeromyxobacter oryzae]|uniref:Uncharacterized protein n=1 Tax=Anaeromyxobacter oryzae TaxID=2918170 RepID=A0ABN6MVQ2_9BACT|nr:hypothetical protein [Anaeromyxobacter oryzae]BDG04986.1 hypothetical protein AMOR_39820 [Anaeromyxobacter oryzae]
MKKKPALADIYRQRYLEANRYRLELRNDLRSVWMEWHGVRPARRDRTRLHLLDRRDREAVAQGVPNPLRCGLDHVELWECVETGDMVGLTSQPYFADEAEAMAAWEERLKPLTTDHGFVVSVSSPAHSWWWPLHSLLIEIWRRDFRGVPVK